jgi:hypothetical protein
MAAPCNTIVFTSDPASPRISAFDLHEWLHEVIRIQEQKLKMIQNDGIKRQVYVKPNDRDYVLSIINETGRRGEYKHTTGDISIVEIAVAGMGYKKIRVANVPAEENRRLAADFIGPIWTSFGRPK